MRLGPERTALQDIGARIIDGAQVIPNQSYTLSRVLICLGAEAISGPITSDLVDSSRQ